jgi:pSer/pThr/pTyr-binding forkhead associated (FHA) protein
MAKLIFSFDNKVLSEFQLNKQRVSIGRKSTNDIHIDNLAVSGEHALILKVGDYFYVEDQQSTNGTELNTKLVKSHLLESGDIISFGKHQLKFIGDESPKAQNKHQNDGVSVFDKTVFMRPAPKNKPKQLVIESQQNSTEVVVDSDVAAQEADKLAATPLSVNASTPAISVGRIQVLNGTNVGRELILNKAITTLGKTGVQVAVITRRPHGYFIAHVEGKVFPTVNGTSSGSQAFALGDHDVIELAGVKMEFYLDKI